MTPEERKAIAMRVKSPWHNVSDYPNCCSYHEGFDDALALLKPTGYGRSSTHNLPTAYLVEATP